MSFSTFLKKHPLVKILLIISVIPIAYVSYSIYEWTLTQSTDNAYVEADISSVSSEINGVICEVLVEENNYVKAGQIIAKINDTDLRAQYEKASAEWEGANHEIDIIEQDITLSKIDQAKALEAFEFAETNFKISKADYGRIQELNKENFASKKHLDDTEVAFEKAKTEYSQAKLNMQVAVEKLALLEIKKLAAVANLKTMAQERALAERALSNTEIRSPIDGVLGNSSLKLGNYIRAGVVLFVVVPTHKLYVKANFKETQISKFKAGMKASLEFDSEPGEITGTIRNVSPATGAKFSLLPPANATGNFTKIVQRVPVVIDFDVPEDKKNKIVPGMSTVVKVRID
jgi:membrane fusion protein (multidrug efflux system)